MWQISKTNLEALLAHWDSANELFIPIKDRYGEVMLRLYEPHQLTLDYINFAQPAKEFVFKGREKLFTWEASTQQTSVTPIDQSKSDRILFGLRACDVHGIHYMDRFYQGEYCDDIYKKNRSKALIVALNCIDTGKRCFCSSVDSGPFAKTGYDLLLTPLVACDHQSPEGLAQDLFLVEIGTEAGKVLLEGAKHLLEAAPADSASQKEEVEQTVKTRFKTKLETGQPHEVLRSNFEHPIWDELAAKCIRCGGCTNVCPTCTCYNVVEELSSPFAGTRIRAWDSCQSDSFTTNAGGHKTRNDVSRVRYRIFDKLRYIEERFGHKGCTGCGRCVTACPVDIDIVNVVNRLAQQAHQSQQGREPHQTPPADETRFPDREAIEALMPDPVDGHVHQNCEGAYLPHVAVIKDIIQETRSIKRFYLQYEDPKHHETFEFKGQFFEITVFGVGEIAISIPFSQSQTDVFDFCIKKVGKVTGVLHDMKVGDKVGLRGPFGKGFPLEDMKGRDLLIVGSGVGVAPVRTTVLQATEQRESYGKIAVIGSAMTYEDLIYKDDFVKWSAEPGFEVRYALSKATDQVPAFVGRINDLLPELSNDWKNTTAIICASPNRIREVAKDLIGLGMDAKQIYTSLETHMRCGLGKCGHCKVGSKYMCVDGPVFNYEEMLQLPPEF